MAYGPQEVVCPSFDVAKWEAAGKKRTATSMNNGNTADDGTHCLVAYERGGHFTCRCGRLFERFGEGVQRVPLWG